MLSVMVFQTVTPLEYLNDYSCTVFTDSVLTTTVSAKINP